MAAGISKPREIDAEPEGRVLARAGIHDFQQDIDAIGRNAAVPTMLETVCLATGLRFAAIARVTEARWVTCLTVDRLAFGLEPGDELVVETTLCHEVRQMQAEVVIDDVQSSLYCNHPTPRQYGFRSYLSIPIRRADGSFFGTLCALDPEPNRLTDPRVLQMVRLFAKLVGDAIDAEERLNETRSDLQRERRLADVQEEFMAILAHDLRNPVSALSAGLALLGRGPLDDRARGIVALMGGSVRRMRGLIDNLMDHARNRLGGGIVVERVAESGLEEALAQIIGEYRTVSPDQEITATFALPQPISCDRARIAQLLANLLGNAVVHGASGRPIAVEARVAGGTFELTVANEGEPIPADRLASLFEPFSKGGGQTGREGLGLGLYIAAEIARAHGGGIEVRSDAAGTVFAFRMPV